MTPTIPNTFTAQLPIIFQFDDMKNDSAQGEAFATSYGITDMSWGEAIDEGIVPHISLAQATRDQCIGIIRANYYNRCRISSLPAGAGLMVFNDAVLSGAGHAVALLQRIVGAGVDGVAGNETVSMADDYVAHYGLQGLIDKLYVADETYLAALANAPRFLNGWDRREDVVRAAAYKMAGVAAVPVAKPSPVSAAVSDDAATDALNNQQLAKDQA